MKKQLVLVLALLTFLSGCTIKATTTAHTPLLERRKPNHIKLYIPKFEDERVDKKYLGHTYLLGIHIANILSPDSDEWMDVITSGYQKEFRHAGYKIVEEADQANYIIKGKLLFSSLEIGRISTSYKIETVLSLYDGSDLIFEKLYTQSRVPKKSIPEQAQDVLKLIIHDIDEQVFSRQGERS